jgi:hypothetical protein
MKDPVGYLRIPAGFFIRVIGERNSDWVRGNAERNTLSGILPRGDLLMPPWMEILLNVIGYAGFIGIAKYHKPSNDVGTDRCKRDP